MKSNQRVAMDTVTQEVGVHLTELGLCIRVQNEELQKKGCSNTNSLDS